jgi:predicted 3-demethylubiquinone-9 3-methyltransferase (glyoxalase superfamily)
LFNGNASEAVDFYLAAFPDSKILTKSYYPKSTAEGWLISSSTWPAML